MNQNKKILLATVVFSFIIMGMMFVAFKGANFYYVNVSDLQHKVEIDEFRVTGEVVAGTIVDAPSQSMLTFTMADIMNPDIVVDVVFKGIKPDAFSEGQHTVVEGTYDRAANVFYADTMLVKCPSKYEEEEL